MSWIIFKTMQFRPKLSRWLNSCREGGVYFSLDLLIFDLSPLCQVKQKAKTQAVLRLLDLTDMMLNRGMANCLSMSFNELNYKEMPNLKAE